MAQLHFRTKLLQIFWFPIAILWMQMTIKQATSIEETQTIVLQEATYNRRNNLPHVKNPSPLSPLRIILVQNRGLIGLLVGAPWLANPPSLQIRSWIVIMVIFTQIRVFGHKYFNAGICRTSRIYWSSDHFWRNVWCCTILLRPIYQHGKHEFFFFFLFFPAIMLIPPSGNILPSLKVWKNIWSKPR